MKWDKPQHQNRLLQRPQASYKANCRGNRSSDHHQQDGSGGAVNAPEWQYLAFSSNDSSRVHSIKQLYLNTTEGALPRLWSPTANEKG